MRTYHRTPQQRDRRFARVRRMTQTVLIGSGVASGVFVGYAASTAKPVSTVRPPSGAPATSTGATTPTTTLPSTAGSQAPSTVYTPPTTAPVTTTTACYTTPSGTTVCY